MSDKRVEKGKPDQDDPKLRDDPDEKSEDNSSGGNNKDVPDDPREIERLEKERKERDLLEAARLKASRAFGIQNIPDSYVRAIGDFDPNETRIQAAEFYTYRDSDIERKGYI